MTDLLASVSPTDAIRSLFSSVFTILCFCSCISVSLALSGESLIMVKTNNLKLLKSPKILR